MTDKVTAEDCTHPQRGGQEHIMGSGSGDYHCRACGEAMPIMGKPDRCILCNSRSGSVEPDSAHGKSWHCPDCGRNWGWVRS